MLKKLTVENYALIENLDLVFNSGLNIITGETGAGKSILLGALGLLLGNKTDVSVLRDAGKNCVVEGNFDIGGYGLQHLFDENDLDYEPVLLIRRIISPSGKSRCFVNDIPVQQSVLRELGSYLIDIHSQHHNTLLREDGFKTELLDGVAAQKSLFSEYSERYKTLRMTERELKELKLRADSEIKEKEWLAFQLEELELANIRVCEVEENESLRDELAHASEIIETLSASSLLLNEDETGIISHLKSIEHSLERLSTFYSQASYFGQRLRTAAIELQDLEMEMSVEAGRIDSDPNKLNEVGARLDLIYGLLQKHNVTNVDGLLSKLEDYRLRFKSISGLEDRISDLQTKAEALTVKCNHLADKLSEGRSKATRIISEKVGSLLVSLGMPDGKLIISVNSKDTLGPMGRDELVFLFTANPDSDPKPIEKVASGGEVSRLMLAIKSVLACSNNLPTIIFDEIDTGVSGRIADSMGNIINELSQNMQVVNITHLPQVACKGDTHFYVHKEDSRTSIKLLNTEERVESVAAMLSGSDTTEAAKKQARILLGI